MTFGKYVTNSLFIAYHPTNLDFVKQRFAESLYLLSLNATKNSDGTWTLNSDSTTSSLYSFLDVSPVLRDVVRAIQASVVVVTKQASEINITGQELPADFSSNPFAYVEFIDDSWKSLSLDLVSTPLSQLQIDSTLPLYSVVSPFFVNVQQPFNYGLYIDGSVNPIEQANIQLNGQDRFTARDGSYFNYVQPYQHHTNTPADGINLYSFALNPEEHQPSGTCNFSRIDFSQLNLKTTDVAKRALGDSSVINIYTVNYNILRIMGGMGGLALIEWGIKVTCYSNLGSYYRNTFELLMNNIVQKSVASAA